MIYSKFYQFPINAAEVALGNCKWFDFRERELVGDRDGGITISHALIDEFIVAAGLQVTFERCWILNPQFHAIAEKNTKSEVKTSHDIFRAFSLIQNATDFELRPMIEAYFKLSELLELHDRITLSLPLIWSENEVVSRNALFYLFQNLDPSAVQSDPDLVSFVLILLTHQPINQDVWSMIEKAGSQMQGVFVRSLLDFEAKLQGKCVGEIRTALAVLKAAQSRKWAAEINLNLPILGVLLLHPNPEVRIGAFQILKSMYQRNVLNFQIVEEILAILESVVHQLEDSYSTHEQKALAAQIRKFLR